MDFKDAKTQKIALAVLAFFVVVYFWYTRLYTVYDNKITTKSREFETITTNLRNVELKAKSLDALQVEYSDLINRYHEIEALLPEVKQIPSLLVQLHTASSLTGTEITRVQPVPIESASFYNVATFEIDMTGGYHNFGKFLSYIANFPFIANVSDVKVTAQNLTISAASAEDASGFGEEKQKETIKATFTLSTYFVKEDERLEELAL